MGIATSMIKKEFKRLDFFKALYRRCNGYIELRAIPKMENERRIPRVFVSLGTDWKTISEKVDSFCNQYKDRNLYFGVATRDGKGGKKKNVVHIPCVWADIDYKDIPREEFEKKLEIFSFKPSIIVNSGHGVHLYFLLDKPVEQKNGVEIEKINEWIASEIGGDDVHSWEHILRIPDTNNHKYEEKTICKIKEVNDD